MGQGACADSVWPTSAPGLSTLLVQRFPFGGCASGGHSGIRVLFGLYVVSGCVLLLRIPGASTSKGETNIHTPIRPPDISLGSGPFGASFKIWGPARNLENHSGCLPLADVLIEFAFKT